MRGDYPSFVDHEFNSDRNIVGKTISVDGRPGTVIGVLPESFVFTFPEVSVWLLPRWGKTTNNFADRTGAVLRMEPHATLAQAKQEFRRLADDDGYAQPQMESFVSRAHQGAKLYLFFTVLSLLGGIALGSSRLGGAKTRKIKLSFRHTLRWWGFFSLKTLLLLAHLLCRLAGTNRQGLHYAHRLGASACRPVFYLAVSGHGDGRALLVTA